jgi:hypothetical protein
VVGRGRPPFLLEGPQNKPPDGPNRPQTTTKAQTFGRVWGALGPASMLISVGGGGLQQPLTLCDLQPGAALSVPRRRRGQLPLRSLQQLRPGHPLLSSGLLPGRRRRQRRRRGRGSRRSRRAAAGRQWRGGSRGGGRAGGVCFGDGVGHAAAQVRAGGGGWRLAALGMAHARRAHSWAGVGEGAAGWWGRGVVGEWWGSGGGGRRVVDGGEEWWRGQQGGGRGGGGGVVEGAGEQGALLRTGLGQGPPRGTASGAAL